MRHANNQSWNHLGVRGRDGVLEALPFRAWIHHSVCRPETRDFGDHQRYEGNIYRVEWHTLKQQSGEISETLSTMPLEARFYGTAVACGNRVYVLGGFCLGDPCCPDKKFGHAHHHNSVFYFDCESLDGKWKQAPPMLAPRFSPAAVATPRKIYVFGSTPEKAGPLAEVFNVELNRWDKLPDPLVASDLCFQSASRVVLFQSSRSRIVVYFGSDYSLQAFNLISESWECLDPSLRHWSDVSVVVGDVIYSLYDPPYSEWFIDFRKYFGAYHLVHKKWLDVKWLCKSPVPAPTSSIGIKLFHLGKGLMCIAWYSSNFLHYKKFCVRFDSGKIYASVEKNEKDEKNEVTEGIINVPFKSFNSGKINATVGTDEENEDSECIIDIPFECFNSDFMLV